MSSSAHQTQPDQLLEIPKGVGLETIPKTCLEEGDISSLDSLRARITFISGLNGLDGTFSDDSVLLLNQALHVDLILKKMLILL